MKNCIEALKDYLENNCIACRYNALIIEFEDLPEEEKHNFDFYDKDKHFLLHCERCKVYKILPES